MDGKRNNASVAGAFQIQVRKKQPALVQYPNVSQGQKLSSNGWDIGEMMRHCLKTVVVGNGKTLRWKGLRACVEKPKSNWMLPSPEERNTAEAQPFCLSITAGATPSPPQVSRYQFFPPQPLPESETLPRWSSVSCSWAQEESPPRSTCRRIAASPPPPGGEEPGRRAARTRRGVATARIADLVLQGAPGVGRRDRREDRPAWPNPKLSSDCRYVNQLSDPQSTARSLPLPLLHFRPEKRPVRQSEACAYITGSKEQRPKWCSTQAQALEQEAKWVVPRHRKEGGFNPLPSNRGTA